MATGPPFRSPGDQFAWLGAVRLAELLREIGARHGRTTGEVAIAWTLRHPAVTAAIVGVRTAAHVDGVIGAATFRLSEAEIDEIGRFMAENPNPA